MKNQIKKLKESFSLNKQFLVSYLYDILFYIIILPCFFISFYILSSASSNIDSSLLENIASLAPEKAQIIISQWYSLVALSLALALLLFIIASAAWSLSRSLIYTSMLKEKFSLNYYIKFFLLNIFYLLKFIFFFIIPLACFTSVITIVIGPGEAFAKFITLVMMIAVLILSYFISLSYIIFTKNKEKKIFKSWTGSLDTGIANIKRFLFPSAVIFIFFAIIGVIISNMPLLTERISLSPFISVILIALIFTLFTTWARRYFIMETENLVK